jgi:hypothetical protein
VNEGVGLLNDTLFIEVEGVAEPTLFVQLSMQGPLGGKINNVTVVRSDQVAKTASRNFFNHIRYQ